MTANLFIKMSVTMMSYFISTMIILEHRTGKYLISTLLNSTDVW